MKAKVEKIDLTYEVVFAAPSFDLPISNVSVLKAFYETIHPHFPINERDMQATGGNLLSDVHVRIPFINGKDNIDISFDRMSLVFNNLRTRNDLTDCKECTSLSEKALQESLPDVSPLIKSIKPMVFLTLQGETQNVSNYLSRLPGSSITVDLSAHGIVVQHRGINHEVINTEDGWSVNFHTIPDRAKISSLILSCFAIYSASGAVQGLETVANHLEQLLNAFFDSIDLETEGMVSWV